MGTILNGGKICVLQQLSTQTIIILGEISISRFRSMKPYLLHRGILSSTSGMEPKLPIITQLLVWPPLQLTHILFTTMQQTKKV